MLDKFSGARLPAPHAAGTEPLGAHQSDDAFAAAADALVAQVGVDAGTAIDAAHRVRRGNRGVAEAITA